MIRRNDVSQSSLSEFSDVEGKGRYNSITNDSSILTARINRPKLSDYRSSYWTLPVQTMRYCSRFESCSAMKCPLDPFISQRSSLEDEQTCSMAKATRHGYWESMPEYLRRALPFQGYLEGEFRRIKAAKERWNSLPEDRKAEIRARMKNGRR
jgi:hypothetical protein